MPKLIKFLRNILFLSVLITLIVHFVPITTIVTSNKVFLTNEELNNLLTFIDISLSTILAVYTLVDQKLAEQKCIYDFNIAKNSLSLQTYRRFPSETENSFTYVCKREADNIDEPYYGMELILEDKALCSVGIPLCMKVSTELDGECIAFSDLKVCITRQGKIEKRGELLKGVVIEKPIQEKKEFLVRLLLLCNHELEKILLDSCIYMSFVLTLCDDRRRKYNKYLFLKIQNTMGESRILSISSRSNWLSYIGELAKQHYRLSKAI